MAFKIKNCLAEIAAAGIIKALCINQNICGKIVVNKMAVFNYNFL